jgi:hypothetical protein
MARPRIHESREARNKHHTERRTAILHAARELQETIAEAAEAGNETARQLLGANETETIKRICALFPNSPESLKEKGEGTRASEKTARPLPTFHR